MFVFWRICKNRIRFFSLPVLLLIFLHPLYGAETEPFYREFSAGIGADLSGYSKDGFSIGGLASVDYRFLRFLTVGVKSAYGYDFVSITHLEAEIFARWYFLDYSKPLNGLLVFAHIEGGGAGILRNTGDANDIWSPVGALGAGARLKLPLNLYFESYVRAGYPFIWSASIGFGYIFSSKPRLPGPKDDRTKAKSKTENPASEAPALKSVEPLVEGNTETPAKPVNEPAPAVKYPPVTDGNAVAAAFGDIIFRDNGADFTDLDGAIIVLNNEILDRVVEFLKQNPEYKLRIEGYANPVQTNEQAKAVEEERFLLPISRERANTILELLTDRGISRSRLTAVGLGGKKTVADMTDKGNWQKNRRVEFVLLK